MNDHTTYLAALFPRWKLTPELSKLVDRDFDRARITDEQIRAIIDQHRRERKGNDPDLATISVRMSNAVAQADDVMADLCEMFVAILTSRYQAYLPKEHS